MSAGILWGAKEAEMLKAAAILMLLGAPAAARAEAAEEPDKAAHTVEDLKDLPQISALCLATRPASRVYFGGTPKERGEAAASYKAARAAALDQLYRMRIAQDGFRLGDEKREEIPLDLSFAPRALDSAVTLVFPSDAAVPLKVEKSDALSAALKSHTLGLVAYFELSDEQGAVCSGSVAAQVFSIAALPVAFELRDGSGQVLARGETARADRFRALIGGYRGTPSAVFGAVDADGIDAPALGRKLAAASESLRHCYAERLKVRNDVGGTLVVGMSVDEKGAVGQVNFIADALHDEPLQKCAEEELRQVSFAGVAGLPTLFRVPVEFRLARR